MKLVKLLLCLLFAAAACATENASPKLPRSTPEAQGVSSAAILKFVEEADAKVNAIHSFMLVRHGHVVSEGWWSPYAAEEPHLLFSLSKSFTSTAVGLAIAEGKLSVDDLVLKFFPEDAPASPSKNLRAMRVRDLLTMSTGHHEEDIKGFPFTSQENLMKVFLALPVTHKPGTLFVYSSPATFMLSAIVQKVTGQTVLDYLKPRLFEPLGIENPTWQASAQGISLGGSGLSLRTEDIAHFGQLYLQKGQWQGKQLVPAAWVEDATSRHMSNGSDPNGDWDQGYGYQFWRCRHGFYRGDGAFGQFCIVMPEYDAVIAITSGTKDMGLVMNLIWDNILPGLKAAALPEDSVALEKLTTRLAHVSLPVQTGAATSTVAKTLSGKRYIFPANDLSIEAITLEPAAANGDQAFTVRMTGMDQRVIAAHDGWHKGALTTGETIDLIATNGAWTADDTYTLKLSRYRTPFLATYRLRFTGDQLLVSTETNVGSGSARTTELVGKRE